MSFPLHKGSPHLACRNAVAGADSPCLQKVGANQLKNAPQGLTHFGRHPLGLTLLFFCLDCRVRSVSLAGLPSCKPLLTVWNDLQKTQAALQLSELKRAATLTVTAVQSNWADRDTTITAVYSVCCHWIRILCVAAAEQARLYCKCAPGTAPQAW